MTLLSLQKALALLVMPAGLLWLLLLVASVVCFRKQRWAPALVLLGGWLLCTVAGNVYLGSALMARLESAVPPVAVATLEPFDAVLVLGGGSDEDALGQPQLGCAGDRLLLAARLWQAGKARLLVASGVNGGGIKGFRDGGVATRALWLELGIPDRAILVVPEPCWVTRDEIRAYRKLQDLHRWQRTALLSSASHLPRAMALAERAGLVVTPVGANWRGRRRPFELKLLVPQAEGFMDVQLACWELLGRRIGR